MALLLDYLNLRLSKSDGGQVQSTGWVYNLFVSSLIYMLQAKFTCKQFRHDT